MAYCCRHVTLSGHQLHAHKRATLSIFQAKLKTIKPLFLYIHGSGVELYGMVRFVLLFCYDSGQLQVVLFLSTPEHWI